MVGFSLAIFVGTILSVMVSDNFVGLAMVGLVGLVGFLVSSSSGKARSVAKIIDMAHLGGVETCLDLGCGTGRVLVELAGALDRGFVVGIDRWRKADQFPNGPEIARRNLVDLSPPGRWAVISGDGLSLPFRSGSFTLVVSNLMLHNVHGAHGKFQVLREIARVLAPGGLVIISDVGMSRRYIPALKALGLGEFQFRGSPPWYFAPNGVLSARLTA